MNYADFVPYSCAEYMAIFFGIGLLSGVVLARLLWFDVLDKINNATKPASESSPPPR